MQKDRMEKHAQAFIDSVINKTDHPAIDEAQVFPLLPEDELVSLGKDIREQRKVMANIIMSVDGKLVDGRNRTAALSRLNFNRGQVSENGKDWIQIDFYDEPRQFMNMIVVSARLVFSDNPARYKALSIASNILRRHLTPAQRAAIMVKINPKMDVAERSKKAATTRWGKDEECILSNDKLHKSDDDLAAEANVSRPTISRARQDQALDPTIIDATIAADTVMVKALREEAKTKKKAKPKASKPKAETGSDSMILQLFVQLKKEGRTRDQLIALIDKAFI